MTDDAPAVTAPVRKPSARGSRGVWLFIRDILIIVLVAILVSFLLKTFIVRSFYIPSGSMENTLQVNDRVLVSLLTPGAVPLKHGDVIVFEDPGGWLRGEVLPPKSNSPITAALAFIGLVPPDDDSHLIKRVIGLPGDHVKCCTTQGLITVNGKAITEPYINLQKAGLPDAPDPFSVIVPKGELWVMGDNRYDSKDSAYHEAEHDATPFVPITDVTGRAMVISWPVSRWKYLDDYPDVFRGIDSSK
jgi:signal peptidase I